MKPFSVTLVERWFDKAFFEGIPLNLSATQFYVRLLRSVGWEGPYRNSICFGPAMVCLRQHRGHIITIADFWVSPSARGQGTGSEVLAMLIRAADDNGITLRLRPRAFDRRGAGMDTPALWAWYEHYGFVRDRTWATRKACFSHRNCNQQGGAPCARVTSTASTAWSRAGRARSTGSGASWWCSRC